MTNEEAFVIIILIKFLQAFFILCVELFVMMYQQYPMTKEEDSVLMALNRSLQAFLILSVLLIFV